MDVYTIICLMYIKIILIKLPTKLRPHEIGKFWLPTYIVWTEVHYNMEVSHITLKFQVYKSFQIFIVITYVSMLQDLVINYFENFHDVISYFSSNVIYWWQMAYFKKQ